MTLLQFIKSNLIKDSALGRLCKDIQGDRNFPMDRSEEGMLSYIKFKTSMQKNSSIFKKFVHEFEKQNSEPVDCLDLNANFALLRSENWEYFKAHFSFDKVVLVGTATGYYKVYCLDSSSDKALFFDLGSSASLNELQIKKEINIPSDNLVTSPANAIILLNNCKYTDEAIPNKLIFDGLIDILSLNV